MARNLKRKKKKRFVLTGAGGGSRVQVNEGPTTLNTTLDATGTLHITERQGEPQKGFQLGRRVMRLGLERSFWMQGWNRQRGASWKAGWWGWLKGQTDAWRVMA